jgi:hypothetical protein
MKSKIFLPISVCLFSLLDTTAQTKTDTLMSDYVDARSYKTMHDYLASNFIPVRNSDPIDDAMKVNQGKHVLIERAYEPSEPPVASNNSWDNILPTVYQKDALVGSPWLLPYYIQGLVINNYDSVLNKPDYLYNYDKKSGNLLLLRGTEPPIAVNKEQVNAFCLKMDKGGYIFERVPFINADEFFQVIYKGPKFCFYKLYKNKLINSHKTTNGYVTEGNNYDEYADILTYYVIDKTKKETAIFELKKSSLRKALTAETEFVSRFYKDHKTATIDEDYLYQLAEALNK